MTARPIRRNAQTPDRNGKIFYTSTTSLSHISKEPGHEAAHISFDKKYKMISENLHGGEIELPIGTGKQGQFSNGFYNCDYTY